MPRKKNPHSIPYVKPDYHSGNKKKSNDELNNDDYPKKKIKLRSSLDIYNRLIHDKTLNIDLNNVNIGYSDHVLGDQEMCILDWTMIDKGGDIPMHHILYFILILDNKNKIILWDRKSKLDRLYGSGMTNDQQRFNLVINSTKIRNNQKSQKKNKKKKKKILSHDELKQNDDNNNEEMKMVSNINKMPKQLLQKDEMVKKYFPRYPTTDDGFVESFDINDTQNWLKYLNYYGLVVIKVLNEKESNKTINSMFNELYHRTLHLKKQNNDNTHKTYKVDKNNPWTWTKYNWPSPYGKFLTDRPAFSKQAFKNRCSQKMHFIWSKIFETKELNVTIENWGIQRGTVNLKFIDPKTNKITTTIKDESKWRRNLRPHWDVNPWTYSENTQSKYWINLYQGALALSEQRLIDGTHLTLPGCARFLKKWCQENKANDISHSAFKHNISFDDGIIKYMQAIPLRKGEMVIWNFGQLHANTKNMSDKMRLSQYMRMIPSQKKYIQRDRRSVQQQSEKYKNDLNIEEIMGDEMDERMKKLLGLKKW